MKDLVVRLGNKQIVLKDCDDDVEEVVDFFSNRVEELEKVIATKEDDLSGVEEKLGELESEKKEWESYREASLPAEEVEEMIQKEAIARVATISAVGKLKPDLEIDTTLGVRGLQELAIKAIAPNIELEGKDEATIAGIWQGIQAIPPAPTPSTPLEATLPSGSALGGARASDGEQYIEETYNLAGRFS